MANSFHLAFADTTERETFFEKTGEFPTKGPSGLPSAQNVLS